MGDLPVTIADIVVVLILGISALLAFGRGFVHEVLSFGAWIAAIIAVILLLPLVRPFVRDVLPTPILADGVGGLVIFLIALVLFSFITRAVSQRVKDSPLNAIDRSLGFVFGLLRGALLVCLIYIPIQWILPADEQPAWLREAHTRPLVENGANTIRNLVSPGSVNVGTADGPVGETGAEALDPERLARDIMSPEPRSPEPEDDGSEKGYGERDRRALERLLDTDQ